MKKIFYFIASAIVALGAVACQNEIEEGIDANTSKEGLSFTAVIDDATRIALGNDGKTAWDGDDTIVVKYNENNYEFTNTEENPNTFTCTDTEVMEIVGKTISATYSYNKDGKINSKAGFAGSVLHCEEGTITAEGAEITMVLTNSLLYFTATDEVTFTSSEAIFVVDGVAVNELTVAASEDVQYVAVMPTESTNFAYLSNGAIVKSLNGFKFGVATKYNLGTLTAADAVATVNGVKYATLDKAIEAAIAADNGVVEVAGNVELDKLIAIDGEVTIDGSGIISADGDVFKLMENANITIGRDIVLESATDCAIFTSAGANNVTVTLNGTAKTNSANYAAVQFNGGTTDVNFTLGEYGYIEQNGGEIALMLPAGGNYTINGSITGGTGIYLKGGNLTINGGVITANGAPKAYEHMGSGAVSTGDAVVVESCDYPYAPATLTINGGVFDSNYGAALAHYVQADKPADKDNATISVKGGTFSSNPTAFVAEGYAVVKDEDTYTVKTLAEAITNGANVILPNGTYELTSLAINDKTFSLTGESKDGVIIQHLAGGNSNYGGYTANVTFNNLTFKNDTSAYGDILANKVTYNECIYIGTMVTYSHEVYANHTDFVPAASEYYNVHIYGEGSTKFYDCSFTTTASRSVYAHAESQKEMNITFDNCTFKTLTQLPAGEWRFHPAIRLHTESPSDIYGTLTIKDTEIIGENTFGNTYNDGLWVEWNNSTKERTSKFVTTVDGVDVTYVRDYTFDEVNNTYFVYTPDGLVEVFNIFEAGATINIVEDLDMTGKTIAAVTGNKGFQLNGSDNTISNLKGTQQGLFVNNTGSAKYYFYDIKLENCSVESSTNYAGLFVGDADTCDELEIVRCEVTDCTVESGKYAAALVAYTAGYNVQNNGPVYSDVTIEDCTVTGGSITGGGSTAVAVGHSGGNVDTTTTIENLTISGVAINGEDAEHTGIAVGTANVGKTIINIVNYTEVTGNYNAEHPLYGRFVPASTGELTIDSVMIGAVAMVNSTYYKTIEEAIAAANGAVVTLLADATVSQQCIVDENGHTLTVTGKFGRTSKKGDGYAYVYPTTDWKIVGSTATFGNWAYGNSNAVMLQEYSTVVVIRNVELAANTEFKFCKDGSWNNGAHIGTWGENGANSILYDNWYDVGSRWDEFKANIKNTSAGTYDLFFATDTGSWYVTKSSNYKEM